MSSRLLTAAASALAIASTSISAGAQIVNVQPLVADDGKQGFGGSFDGSFLSQGGNTTVFGATAQLITRYRAGHHLAFVLGSASYGTSDHETNTNKDLEHLRYRLTIHEPFEAETFVQHERDEFRRLGLRMLFGLGPRLHFAAWAPMEVAFGTAWMLEAERLQRDGLPDAGEDDVNQRWSSYASFTYAFGDKLKVGYTFYVQPRLDDFSDYRILSDLAVSSAVDKRWSFKFSASLAYDSRPPYDVKSIDATRSCTVSITF